MTFTIFRLADSSLSVARHTDEESIKKTSWQVPGQMTVTSGSDFPCWRPQATSHQNLALILLEFLRGDADAAFWKQATGGLCLGVLSTGAGKSF